MRSHEWEREATPSPSVGGPLDARPEGPAQAESQGRRPGGPPSAERSDPERAHSMPLLLIADQPTVRENLARLLRDSDCEVIECASREQGTDLLQRMQFRATLVALSGKEAEACAPRGRSVAPAPAAPAEGTELLGQSPAMQDARRLAQRLAPTPQVLLISGERGTGKKSIARAIHRASPQAHLPFFCLDCRTMSESSLEGVLFGQAAQGGAPRKAGLMGLPGCGTVYLGAIEAMSLPLQRRLLLAIEDRRFVPAGDTVERPLTPRLICGTFPRPAEQSDRPGLLEDLACRLALYEVRIPPLREQIPDIPALARHFIRLHCRRLKRATPSMEAEVEQFLMEYPWPGNVRELSNVMERTVLSLEGPVLRLRDLPETLFRGDPRPLENLKAAREDFERRHLTQILMRYGGDKRRAARALGVNLSTLYRLLQRGNPL